MYTNFFFIYNYIVELFCNTLFILGAANDNITIKW